MKVALIKNGKVDNIAEFDRWFEAQAMFAESEFTPVLAERYDIVIGDTYKDGIFYHDGQAVEPRMTTEEMLVRDMELIKQSIHALLSAASETAGTETRGEIQAASQSLVGEGA